MSVVNIPPDNKIYALGKINGQFHVYDTGRPVGGITTYDLTIVNVNHWQNIQIQGGHTHTYNPGGNAVYIQNHGGDVLQCLYLPLGRGLLPYEAGIVAVDEIEGASLPPAGQLPVSRPTRSAEASRQFIAALDLGDLPEGLIVRQPRLEDDKPAAYVDDGSLVTFGAGVSKQHKSDVLNSCLLAQLAANKQFDREEKPKEWYDYYKYVLENVAWVIRGWEFQKFETSGATFDMQDVVIKVLAAIATGNDVAIIKETIEALKALSKDDHRVVLFDRSTTKDKKGNFQVSAATETDMIVAMKLGAFFFETETAVTSVLWFRFSSSKTSFYKGAQVVALDEEIYKQIREDIVKKLGDRASKFVADIDI
jgi:hypothetical protein